MRIRCALAFLCFAVIPATAQPEPSSGFSDAHVHLNDPMTWVRIMNELGIARSVALRGRDVVVMLRS
jgi:hypothetical protein